MIDAYGDRLRASEWEVREVCIKTARVLIEEHHYARGASNTATYLHGLFKKGSSVCVGVAWWIPPTKSAALATYPQDWKGVLSLSRLAITPEVPKNGCSFLIAKSMKAIDRKRWPCFVTYADEWQQHEGTIYKATNWIEAGRTKPEATYVINGRMISRKAGPKTRTREEMRLLGAELIGRFS